MFQLAAIVEDVSMLDRAVDYVLANAEDQHAASPRSFFIPPRSEREGLAVGDVVKLVFEIVNPGEEDPGGERMWVEVLRVENDRYVGVLANAPGVITTIRWGDHVEFGPEHVISTLVDCPLLEQKILVSRRSHEQDIRPGYLYREEPRAEWESGWVALVSNEPHDDSDDPKDVLPQQVGYLLNRWPELRPVFETEPRNGSWLWDAESKSYVPKT